MIKGIGTDLIELNRIKRQVERNDRLARRVLTPAERTVYNGCTSLQRKAEYLGGRFAAKEAFAKASGEGIGSAFSFQDIEVLNNEKGAPTISVKKLDAATGLFISLTHTQYFASAFIIIEESDSP